MGESTYTYDGSCVSEKPLILTIMLTYACNLKCPFCGQNEIRKTRDFKGSMQLSLEQVEGILDDAVKAGIRSVNLWGGEPLLHPQIFDIIKAVKKRRMRCFVVTNGVLLEKYAEQIVESKADFLQISFDAPGQEHDLVRNHPGLFETIKRGIEKINRIKRYFPLISTSAVILPNNTKRFTEIADSAFGIGSNSMFYQLLMSYDAETIAIYKERLICEYGMKEEDIKVIDHFLGEEIGEKEFQAGVEEAAKVKEKYGRLVTLPNCQFKEEGYQLYMQKEGPFDSNYTKGCWSINYKVNVQTNGDVVLCPDFPDLVIGNVFETSIQEIWNSQLRKKIACDFYRGRPFPICYRCCQLWDKEEFSSWKGVK